MLCPACSQCLLVSPPVSVVLSRCTPCGCWARISRLRSSWAWATTSAQSSRWTTAASAPISTSACRARTAPTTGLRSSSTEVQMITQCPLSPLHLNSIYLFIFISSDLIIQSSRFICISIRQHFAHNINKFYQHFTIRGNSGFQQLGSYVIWPSFCLVVCTQQSIFSNIATNLLKGRQWGKNHVEEVSSQLWIGTDKTTINQRSQSYMRIKCIHIKF